MKECIVIPNTVHMDDQSYESTLRDLEAEVASLKRDYEQASRNLDGDLIRQIESGADLPPQHQSDERAKRAHEFWNQHQRKVAYLKDLSKAKAMIAQGI
jgi:hypothetical protein